MNEQCKHNNPTATCCECLTEKFAQWEAEARARREQMQNGGRVIRQSIRTYHSTALGYVTIPE